MTKATVKRTRGKRVSVNLKLSWNANTVPRAQQESIWTGMGQVLAAAMTPEEARDFLRQLHTAEKAARS